MSRVKSAPAAMHRAASSALRGHRPSLASSSWNARDHRGPFGEQVAAAVRDLPQLGDRGVDVERFPAHVVARGAGDTGGAVTAAASSEEAATGLAAVQ
jgi:hypothetical protein